jgi:hypothetical protein
MRKLLLLPFALFFQNQAFAGHGECMKDLNLTCYTSYDYSGSKLNMYGEIQKADVKDIEPEPFDPADCEAALVFNTDLGTLVANYNHNAHSVTIWQKVNSSKDNVLVKDAYISFDMSATAKLSSAGFSKPYDTLNLTCTLGQNN